MRYLTSTLSVLAFPLAPAALCGLVATAAAQEPRIGGQARLDAWELHRALAQESPFGHLRWRAMGPKFAGGRIESIDVPRGDLATIYACAGAGGIFKSTNGGLTFASIFDEQSTFAIGDLAIAPSDPNVLWVGTGECHLSRSSYAGNGVYRSNDAGATWTHMGLPESAHIGKVVIDPRDPDVVFVAAMGRKNGGGERGIYKTTDGGATFRRVLFEDDHTAFVDLVQDPHDPDRLYCSSWDRRRGPGSGVHRSDDGGETWRRLAGGLLEKTADRVAIDVAASAPGVVYALMADRSSPQLQKRRNAALLYRSGDHGDSWTQVHDGPVPTYVGWDFCDLRVAPDDADRVYVGGLRLIVSRDGGKSFEGEGGFAVNTKKDEVFRLHRHRGVGMHLDVHEITIDPEHPERVLLGNDGGLYVSWDRGATWLHLNNLPIPELYKLHLDDAEPFRIWTGSQDNASFVGPATARLRDGVDDDWQQVFLDPWTGGDGFATFPDPHDPEITYYTQQNGALMRSRLGRLRPEKSIRPRGERGELRFAWDTPFFASVHEGPPEEKTVLYCAAQRVFRSTDRGDSWQAISGDLVPGGILSMHESPLDEKRLAVGGGRGQVHLTADGGATWQAAGVGLPRKRLRDVLLSAHAKERVFAVLSGKGDSDCASYVYRSDDFGRTWRAIAANLPHESLNAIAEDPRTADLLFVGSDLGAYVSLDGGERWESLCQRLPTTPVVDLAVHGRDGKLVIATHGRGVFLLDITPIRALRKQD